MVIDQSAEILRLRATVRDLLALSAIPEAWVGREPPAIAAELADLLIGSLEMDFAFVRLCDPTGCQVVEVTRGSSWKAFPEWLQQRLAMFGHISRKEIVTRVSGVEESCSGIVIPIGVNGERGLVAAACDRSDFPDQIDQQLLSVAANNAATAFRNARLINELLRVQEALRDNEQELRKARDELEIKVAARTSELRWSEKELRDVVDTIPAIVWVALPDGSNTYVNSRFVEYSGVSAAQTAGSGWRALIHPDDLQEHERKWRAAVASGEPHESENRFRRVDGQYRWHLDRGVPLRDEDGNIVKWYGVVTDIEDRKRAEEDLRRKEYYLSEGQRLGHMGSWVFGPGGFDYWSPELFRMYGLNPATNAPTVQKYLDCIHPQDREFMANLIKRILAEPSRFDVTKRIVRPDGEVRYIRCVGAPAVENQGLRKFVGTALDVTDHELLTQELRRREAYLAEAQRLSHTGSFGWRPDSGEIVWSDETYRIFEYDRAVTPTMDLIVQRVHPEDRADFQGVIDRASGGATHFEHAYRLLLPDGRVKHVHALAQAFQDASGNREFVGAGTDITERKNAEEKVREREAELRQVLDLTPQFVAVFGPYRERPYATVFGAGLERLYANRILLEYLGLTLEEWRQTSGRGVFLHPDDFERVTGHSDRALSSGSSFELELRLRKSDGSYRWFLARYNPLRDEQGQITRWYVAATDIEERKQTEERLRSENIALREEISKASMFEQIVGASPALQTVLSRISKVAPAASTVLITGETGTGKELVARAVHRRSQRCSRPFVSVNCAAIPRDLIASELFGHEKGAFTGALQRRLGKFELAEGGTIFLDEIGELPAETQIALLRVLQEHEFERVGGNQAIRTDVRVIAATNRDLQAAIAAGTFRSDLFYRLHVFPIDVPPLRARKGDIAILVEYFIDRYARQAGKKIKSIDKKTLELVQAYPWPGNIRELQNVIERSVVLCETEIFSVDESWLSRASSSPPAASPTLAKKPVLQEKEIIEAALAETRGRVSGPVGAAARLGIPSTTLESKIKSLRINKHQFKV